MPDEGNPAIDRYQGGSPPIKNPYFRQGVIPSGLRYGFDIVAMPGSYSAGNSYRISYFGNGLLYKPNKP